MWDLDDAGRQDLLASLSAADEPALFSQLRQSFIDAHEGPVKAALHSATYGYRSDKFASNPTGRSSQARSQPVEAWLAWSKLLSEQWTQGSRKDTVSYVMQAAAQVRIFAKKSSPCAWAVYAQQLRYAEAMCVVNHRRRQPTFASVCAR